MKKLVLALCVLVMTGCKPETTESTSNYSLPPELSHCKIYAMDSGGVGRLHVVHCPNSQTTTVEQGKHPKSVTVIDVI